MNSCPRSTVEASKAAAFTEPAPASPASRNTGLPEKSVAVQTLPLMLLKPFGLVKVVGWGGVGGSGAIGVDW